MGLFLSHSFTLICFFLSSLHFPCFPFPASPFSPVPYPSFPCPSCPVQFCCVRSPYPFFPPLLFQSFCIGQAVTACRPGGVGCGGLLLSSTCLCVSLCLHLAFLRSWHFLFFLFSLFDVLPLSFPIWSFLSFHLLVGSEMFYQFATWFLSSLSPPFARVMSFSSSSHLSQ